MIGKITRCTLCVFCISTCACVDFLNPFGFTTTVANEAVEIGKITTCMCMYA